MNLYKETLAMDEAIDFVDAFASEADWRASKLQLQIESTKQFLAFEEHMENEKQCRRIAKWLGQLQEIYEIIKNYKDAGVEEKDSAGVFLKICDVVDNDKESGDE